MFRATPWDEILGHTTTSASGYCTLAPLSCVLGTYRVEKTMFAGSVKYRSF